MVKGKHVSMVSSLMLQQACEDNLYFILARLVINQCKQASKLQA
jgi:hypothetical protein